MNYKGGMKLITIEAPLNSKGLSKFSKDREPVVMYLLP